MPAAAAEGGGGGDVWLASTAAMVVEVVTQPLKRTFLADGGARAESLAAAATFNVAHATPLACRLAPPRDLAEGDTTPAPILVITQSGCCQRWRALRRVALRAEGKDRRACDAQLRQRCGAKVALDSGREVQIRITLWRRCSRAYDGLPTGECRGPQACGGAAVNGWRDARLLH